MLEPQCIIEHVLEKEVTSEDILCNLGQIKLKILCAIASAVDCPPMVTVGFKNVRKETREQYVRALNAALDVIIKLEGNESCPFYGYQPASAGPLGSC